MSERIPFLKTVVDGWSKLAQIDGVPHLVRGNKKLNLQTGNLSTGDHVPLQWCIITNESGQLPAIFRGVNPYLITYISPDYISTGWNLYTLELMEIPATEELTPWPEFEIRNF